MNFTPIARLLVHLGPLLLIMGSSLITGCSQSSDDSTSRTTLGVDDQYEIASGVAVTIDASRGVLANDEGRQLVASVVSVPVNAVSGGFQFQPDGSFSYRADTDEFLNDQFTYQVEGADGGVMLATVQLFVYPKPQVVQDEYRVTAGNTLTVAVSEGVLSNDSSERDQLSAILVDEPEQAQSFRFNADGSFSYQPGAGANGRDRFTYQASDGLQRSDTVTVELILDSGVLSGSDDEFSLQSGTAFIRSALEGILANDEGVQDAVVVLKQLPAHAVDFSLSASGDLFYRTVAEESLTDQFSYSLQKEGDEVGPYKVTLNISQPAANQPEPDAYDTCREYTAGQSVSGTLPADGVESPGFELLSDSRFGEITAFDPGSGQYTYQRSTSQRGQDSFSYRIYDAENNPVADASLELIALPYRIMPVGDSITSGVEYHDPDIGRDTPFSPDRTGYRKYLVDDLKSRGYSVDLVGSRNEGYDVSGFSDSQHNGYPGRDDRFVADSMSQWLLENPADILLVHIGTNGTKSHLNHITRTFDNITEWEQSYDNPVEVMLAKLIARTDYSSNANAVVNFNKLLTDFVADQKAAGERVHLVDQYKATGESEGPYLSDDNLHPTLAGYKIMSEEWIRRMRETGVLRKCD